MRLAMLLVLVVALPASADLYVGFAPGSTKQGMVIQTSRTPVAGKDYPADWTVKPWSKGNDSDPNNYKLENDSVVYDPPAILPNTPDVVANEINACLNSKADKLTDAQFVTVLRLSKIGDKEKRDSEWSKLKDSLPE